MVETVNPHNNHYERSGTVAGVEFEATIESHLSVYTPAETDQSSEDGPRYPDLGAFSTPDATIQGNSVNPLASNSLRSILYTRTQFS